MPGRSFLEALILLVLILLVPVAETRAQSPSTFVVTTQNDAGAGSLREAILQANATPNLDAGTPDIIEFNIPGTGPRVIAITSALPDITDPVTIDGYSQPGSIPDSNGPGAPFNGVLQIVIDGSTTSIAGGLRVVTNNTLIIGLVVSGFAGDGVAFTGASSTDNVLTECFIGTDASGTSALPNGRSTDFEFLGIRVGSGASFVTIERNVVSGNAQSGISVDNGASQVVVDGNAVGTDPTGSFAVANGAAGIIVQSGALNNTVTGNLVSGNSSHGIHSFGNASSNLYVENSVGTNLDGTAAIPNSGAGLLINGNSGDQIVDNLISGNQSDGILSNEGGLSITGNYVGTDASGTLPLGNGGNGISLYAGGHFISDNVVGASGFSGIAMQGGIGSSIVQMNAVGTDATGMSDLGNGAAGIIVIYGSQSDIRIEQNAIANNAGEGVLVLGDNLSGIRISQNAMRDNAGPGIDLANDDGAGNVSQFGPTTNDAGDADIGANGLQNFPEILNTQIDGSGNLVVDYRVDSSVGNSAYPLTIEFFSSASNEFEGETFLGSDTYLAGEAGAFKSTNLGNASALNVTPTTTIVATATDANGNTSEFFFVEIIVEPTPDQFALEDLYNAMGGDDWVDNTNWLSDEPLDTWFGVTAVDGLVTDIDLASNNLAGSFPATWDGLVNELGAFSGLQILNLNFNAVSGPIPEVLSDIASLRVIELWENDLSGSIPAALGALPNLQSLNLSSNPLTGSLPPELGNLADLINLNINGTQISGPIPPELGQLSSLRNLYIHANLLSGSIPPELGDLTNLRDMLLNENQLSGSIPSELSALDQALRIDLTENQLTGTIPVELASLVNLESLLLAQNQLSGSIPPELGNMANLRDLNLYSNNLTGPIPVELSSLTGLQTLVLATNQLSGPIPPDLGQLTNLLNLNLASNSLTGTIPVQLALLSNLNYLYLNQNQLTGSIPSELGALTNLLDLLLDNNRLTGTIPPELSALDQAVRLHLSINSLTGQIPPEFGELTAMRSLGLGDNQLTGPIPAELGDLSGLLRLMLESNQLTGELPDELGALSGLLTLSVGNNRLSGAVPQSLAGLSDLQFLFVNDNEFDDLPDLSGLQNLQTLYAYNNLLTFEDLEPNAGLSGFAYSPQKPFGDPDNRVISPGADITLFVPVGGSSNQYQWRKDGLPLTGETDASLVLTDVTVSDAGIYSLSVTNSFLPDLTLLSEDVTVAVSDVVNVVLDQQNILDGSIGGQGIGRFNDSSGDPDPDGTSFDHQDAQTFRTQSSGLLSFITVPVFPGQNQPTEPVQLTLTGVAPAGTPDESQVLGQIQLPAAAFAGVDHLDPSTWARFDVRPLGVTVNPGDELAMILSTIDTEGYIYTPEFGNAQTGYADGTGYRRNAAVTSEWTTFGQDFGFRSYVEDPGSSALVVQPAGIDFGDVNVGSSGQQVAMLRNVGLFELQADLSVTGASASDFTPEVASVQLAPDAEQTVNVTFTPVETAARSASLVISTPGTTVAVSLQGRGVSPVITSTPPAVPAVGSELNVEATVPVSFAPDTREVCYRATGQTSYVCDALSENGEVNSGSIPSSYVTDRGVDYYFRFALGASTYTVPETDPEQNPLRARVNIGSTSAAGPFVPSAYRMISLPFEADDDSVPSVLDEFDAYDPSMWRLFRWNAATQQMEEWPDIDASFTPCTAFWLISRDGTPIATDGGRSTDPGAPCDLTLRPGWNQIANPFSFPIDWTSVTGSDLLQPPVHYNPSAGDSDPYDYDTQTLQPWDGYWVNNPGTNNVQLEFNPIEAVGKDGTADLSGMAGLPGTAGKGGAPGFLSGNEFALRLVASMPAHGLHDAWNIVGFRDAATDKRPERLAEAPGIGSFVRLSLLDGQDRLAVDFRTGSGSGAEWSFEVSAELPAGLPIAGETVRIELEPLRPLPEGFDIYVLGADHRRILPVDGGFNTSIDRLRPERTFRIVIGTADFAAGIADGLEKPVAFALDKNYPNPFRSSTRIRYEISRNEYVSIEVYDALGKRVRTLVDAAHEAGWFETVWDGRDAAGRAAASGVYFYRLTAGRRVLSGSMILLR